MHSTNKYNWREKPTIVKPNVAKGFKEITPLDRSSMPDVPMSIRGEKRRAIMLQRKKDKHDKR